jgi:hypothetical protein
MKVVAFVMMFCLVFLSLFPGKAQTVLQMASKSHCHMATHSPCKPKQANNCGQGTCSNMVSCSACGYLKTELITIKAMVPVIKESVLPPYDMGSLADYSPSNWNPPKV